MVSTGIIAAASSSSMNKQYACSSFQEELEIEQSMRNAKYIDHECEPANSNGLRVLNAFNPVDAESHSDMIHIDVPDTQTLVEKYDGTSKYVAYNIHLNGWYHASVRFSHLYDFAELLKQKFSKKYKGPEFPTKKLFKLDAKAVEERRQKICKYFQAIVQHPEIARHYIVEKKFLDFQVDSYRATSNYVTVDVFLGDGEKLTVKCNVGDSTNDVMKLVSEKLGFSNSDKFIWNFGLFMAKSRDPATPTYSISKETFDPLVVRLLRNFESPFISLSTSNQGSAGVYHILTIRKLIWDPRLEEPLLDDAIFLKLLFKQASQDYRNGQYCITPDIESKLKGFLNRNDSLMFIRTCHLLPSYSYETLAPCISDYPEENTQAIIKLGRRQIVLTHTKDGETEKNIFRATRIRVWRISQTLDTISFQFEYLMARDSFQWITLQTNQSVLMSLLLQSIGAEILNEHNNLSIEQQIMKDKSSKGIHVVKDTEPVVKRDPKKPIIILKNAVEQVDPLGVMENYRGLGQMYTTISDSIPQRNEAFANITDDDL